MGKTITPKYALRLSGSTDSGWNIKSYGRPTQENLVQFVQKYAKSLEFGGVNYHISKALGHIPYPSFAEIRINKPGGAAVATWKAAPFQVWG